MTCCLTPTHDRAPQYLLSRRLDGLRAVLDIFEESLDPREVS